MKKPNNSSFSPLICGAFVRVRLLPEHFQYGRIGSKQTPEHKRDCYYTGIILRRCKSRTAQVSSFHILIISGQMKGHHIVVDYAEPSWKRAIMIPALGLKKAEKFFKEQLGFKEINLMDGFSYLGTYSDSDTIHHANQAIRACATPAK